MPSTRAWWTGLVTSALLLSCRLGYDEISALGGMGGSGTGASGAMGGMAGSALGGMGTMTGSGGTANGGSSSTSGGTAGSAGGSTGATAGSSGSAAQAGAGGAPDVGPVGLGGGTIVSFGMRSGADYAVGNDTYLDEAAPTVTHGLSPAIFVSALPGEHQVGFLYFDVSALAPGTMVTGAELTVHSTADAFGYGDATVHELLESWVDDQATWNERSTGVAWTTPGAGVGSRSAQILAQFTPSTTMTDYQVPLPASLVRGWVDAPASNFGVALEATTDMSQGQFSSANTGSAAPRPLLRVSVM